MRKYIKPKFKYFKCNSNNTRVNQNFFPFIKELRFKNKSLQDPSLAIL